nr:unnamed protein product [Digitaria exilis]
MLLHQLDSIRSSHHAGRTPSSLRAPWLRWIYNGDDIFIENQPSTHAENWRREEKMSGQQQKAARPAIAFTAGRSEEEGRMRGQGRHAGARRGWIAGKVWGAEILGSLDLMPDCLCPSPIGQPARARVPLSPTVTATTSTRHQQRPLAKPAANPGLFLVLVVTLFLRRERERERETGGTQKRGRRPGLRGRGGNVMEWSEMYGGIQGDAGMPHAPSSRSTRLSGWARFLNRAVVHQFMYSFQFHPDHGCSIDQPGQVDPLRS